MQKLLPFGKDLPLWLVAALVVFVSDVVVAAGLPSGTALLSCFRHSASPFNTLLFFEIYLGVVCP